MYDWPTGVRMVVGAGSLLLVFTVPFLRVYLGVHCGTDVLAGFLLGLILLIILLVWYNYTLDHREPADVKV